MSAHWETPLVLQSLCFCGSKCRDPVSSTYFYFFQSSTRNFKNDSSTMWVMYKIAHIYTQVYTRRSWKTQMQRTRNRKHSAGRNIVTTSWTWPRIYHNMLCLADEQRTTSTSFGRTDPIVVTVLNSRSSRSRQVLPRAFRELPEQPRGLPRNELVSRIETCFFRCTRLGLART